MDKPFDFGLLLKEERKKKRITQKQLSSILGVTVTAISKYECGTAYPTFESMQTLAKTFNVSLDYLYGNEKSSSISTVGLTPEQSQLLRNLSDTFRTRNSAYNKKMTEKQYALIGHIMEEFVK